MPLPRHLCIAVQGLLLLLLSGGASAEPQIPQKLLGIWTPDGTTLKGDVVVDGEGIYLDVDGVGALVVRNGDSKSVSRIVVTNYSANDGRLEVNVTEDGGQGAHTLTLSYNAQENVLTSPDEPAVLYHRRKLEMSPDVRAALGLEGRPLAVPSVLAPRAPGAGIESAAQ